MTDPTNATVTHTVNACVGAGGDTGRSQLVDFETTSCRFALASSTMSMDGLAGAPELNEHVEHAIPGWTCSCEKAARKAAIG